MPTWIATNASFLGASPCSSIPPVAIETQADFNRFMANSSMAQATELGTVVITWAGINDTQLSAVLAGKTVLGELVLEGLTQVTTLSPALDSLVNITSRLALNSMPALTSVAVPMLASVGGGVRVYGLSQATSISFPNVTSIGGALFVQSNNVATSVSFPAVTVIGGAVMLDRNNRLTSVSFDVLSVVNGSMTVNNHNLLSGSALSDGFPQLQTVVGMLQMQSFSVSGSDARSTLTFSRLASVGSLYVRISYVTTVSMPALQMVGGDGEQGRFFFQQLTYVRSLDFPALTTVSGQIQFLNLNAIGNLCQIALPPAGYLYTRNVRLSSNLRLSAMQVVVVYGFEHCDEITLF